MVHVDILAHPIELTMMA
jgi:hypothetical protein